MKKKEFISCIVALACAVLLAASCQKGTTEDPEEPYVPQPCQHDSLVFVAGVNPTDTTCGAIEHYECPICHAMFIDEERTISIDDDVIWATSYVPYAGSDYEGLDQIYRTIDAEYKEMSGSSENFAFTAIGIWLFKQVLQPKLTEMLKALFTFHDEKGQGKTFSPEVKAIVEQLSNIESQLKRIADYLQDKEINERVDKRQRELQILRASTVPDFNILMDQIEGFTEKDVLPQERIDTIKMAVNEWYKHGIEELTYRKDPYLTIEMMLDYINGTWSSQKTFPELYDHIAMRSTPWAGEGNKLREAMRAADILSLTEAYIMLSLYYKFNPTLLNKSRYNTIKSKMTTYYKCMERFQVNPVGENEIRWWWQDREGGSKLDEYAMDKAIFHFDYLENNLDKAIADHSKYDFRKDFAEALWLITEENIPVGGFLEFNDYKLINKYIKERKGKIGSQRTLYGGIQDVGFTGLKAFNDGGRIVYRSSDHQFCGPSGQEKSEGYADYMFFSARSHYELEEVLSLQTALDENAKRMDRPYYRTNVSFCTYNPIPSVFRVEYLINKGKRTDLQIQGISRAAKAEPYQPYISK